MTSLRRVRLVAVNAAGLRVGQDHPKALLTDAEVERLRQLHEAGMGYAALAEKFEVSVWTVGRICRHERRNQMPVAAKRVHIPRENSD